jgi:hypothetical protein
MLNRKIFFLLLLFLFVSCASNRNISGTYRSNFAEFGFFVTKIRFNADSTVEFSKAGDLINEELKGKFKISRNNIAYIKFDKLKYEILPDTLPLNELQKIVIDTNQFLNLHSYDLKFENGISYHLKYKIKHNKLLGYNIKTGKIIRRSRGSKNIAKFYLKKVKG